MEGQHFNSDFPNFIFERGITNNKGIVTPITKYAIDHGIEFFQTGYIDSTSLSPPYTFHWITVITLKQIVCKASIGIVLFPINEKKLIILFAFIELKSLIKHISIPPPDIIEVK